MSNNRFFLILAGIALITLLSLIQIPNGESGPSDLPALARTELGELDSSLALFRDENGGRYPGSLEAIRKDQGQRFALPFERITYRPPVSNPPPASHVLGIWNGETQQHYLTLWGRKTETLVDQYVLTADGKVKRSTRLL